MSFLLARSLLFPLLLAGGLLLPGWLLGRVLRTSAGLTGAFLGSSAFLLNLILMLNGIGVPLTPANLALALILVCLVLLLVERRRSRLAMATVPRDPIFRRPESFWLTLPVIFGLGAIAVKALLDPLSGFDTPFRWDFLAQQMFREGNLNFYPATTADDFLRYGWCDGIAPLVSSLYFWSYSSLGRIAAWATAPAVVIQGALLFGVVWQLAARKASPTAGWLAVGLLATSSALLAGIEIGQETGMTALALLAMLLFIDKIGDTAGHWSVWAGLAAGVGALAREYGLAFIFLGAVAMTVNRVVFRKLWQFIGTAAMVSLPWYLRNWIKTGHPLYSHDLGGFFPTNPVHLEYHQIVAERWVVGSEGTSWTNLALVLAPLTGLPLAMGLIAGLAQWRKYAAWLVATLTVGGLWYWSIGATSGGVVYSLRVLTPALALGAAMSGGILARLGGLTRRWVLPALLTPLALNAAVRSLYLPVDPGVKWWREPVSAWRAFDQAAARWRAHPNWAALVDAADGRQIVVSDPLCHAILAGVDGKPVPFFSPAIRFLFEPGAAEVSLRRLRAQGVRFILLTRKNDTNDELMARHPFFRHVQNTPPALTASLYFVYDLYAPELMDPPAPQN